METNLKCDQPQEKPDKIAIFKIRKSGFDKQVFRANLSRPRSAKFASKNHSFYGRFANKRKIGYRR